MQPVRVLGSLTIETINEPSASVNPVINHGSIGLSSGRLVDTYAYDVDSAPATENFGSYGYKNLDKNFVNYEEGIYIGYRFYETFYQGKEEEYQKAVQYPYGYGLSYTDFNWEIVKKDFEFLSNFRPFWGGYW